MLFPCQLTKGWKAKCRNEMFPFALLASNIYALSSYSTLAFVICLWQTNTSSDEGVNSCSTGTLVNPGLCIAWCGLAADVCDSSEMLYQPVQFSLTFSSCLPLRCKMAIWHRLLARCDASICVKGCMDGACPVL